MNTKKRLFAPFMRNPRGLVIFGFSCLLLVGLLVEPVKSGNSPSGTLSASQWTALGPGIINGPFAGRIDVAAPDPSNPNVMYLGSNNGGLWKTTNWLDASPIWTVITDQPQILSLAIHEHDLVVFPGNPNIVLAAASGPGGGILRSEDAGHTWSFLANSYFDLAEFGALVVDPNVANAQTLYVAISGGSANFLFGSGLYKSVDGGATWTDTGSAGGVVFSGFVNDLMQIQENGKTVLYGADAGNGPATSGGIFRKVDDGPWTTTNFPTNTNGYADIRLAGGTTPTELIYASAIAWTSPARNNPGAVTRYSWDTVGSWSTLTWPDASSGGFQHRVHHNLLAVDPANSNNVYVNTDVETNLLTLNPNGSEKYGEFIWKSPDGGKTWNAAAAAGGDPVSGSFDSTGTFISTGDAGIFRDPVNDGTSSAVKGSNLNTIEFYAFSLDPSNPRTAYGLFQDGPGVLKYLGDLNWRYTQLPNAFGESGKIRVDPTNPSRVYYLDPNTADPVSSPTTSARFLHSDDGGQTWTPAITGLPTVTVKQNGVKVAVTDFASFPGKGSIVIDPNNPKRLLLGLATFVDANNVTTTGSVFETTTGGDPNLTDPNFNGNGWRDLGQNIGNNVSTISEIAVAPSDPNTIFVGDEDGRIFKTTTAGAQSPSWTPVDSGLPIFQDMRIMDLQINPTNPDFDFAVISHFMGRDDKAPDFSGFSHVWVRNGGGWSPINGNLPTELGGETLAVDWQTPTPVLYLGTLRGAFKSTDLGTTWALFDSMPRTRVSDLDFMSNLHLLAAGTIGRGAFEILTQSTPPTVIPPANQTATEASSQSFNLGSFSDPDGGPWTVDVNWGDGTPDANFSVTSPGSLGANNHTYQEDGPYTVTIAVTDALDGQSASNTFAVNVSDPAVNASGGFTFQANVGASTGPQAVATFTDPAGAEPNASDPAPPNSSGPYTASIDWGDGTKSTGVITPPTPSTPTQQFTVTGNHTYTMESPVSGFNVITTINHEGVTRTATSTAIVGRAGLVAGSGNIGASLSFSFVAQPGSNNSFKGNLNYQDTINNINVQSTSVTFVSILSDNVHATFSGTAMVNGTSGYTFRVDVEDNGQPAIGFDRFRIQLSGPASYDSNTFAANGGLLTGGHIQLH